MNIPLRIVDRPEPKGRHIYAIVGESSGIKAGDMWREPDLDVEGRESWGIVLPNMTVWYTTSLAGGIGRMWDVSGEAPKITVSPSINDQDPQRPWHGWIRDGELVLA